MLAKKSDSLISFMKVLHEALRRIKGCSNDKSIIVYRVHAKRSYTFIPSLFRKDNAHIKENEAVLLHKIEAARPAHFTANMKTLDKLVTLQHYEFPTRLLDVTSNPLVALYFAALDQLKCNGAVILCKVPESMICDFDSEIVVQLANLANLSYDEKKNLEDFLASDEAAANHETGKYETVPQADDYKALTNINTVGISTEKYEPQASQTNSSCKSEAKSFSTHEANNINIVEQFKKFIKADMPSYPDKRKLSLEELRRPVFVKPKQTNPRILAQQGAFLLFGLSENLGGIIQETITIEHSAKPEIIRELDTFAGINQGVLFPELDKFLTYTRQSARDGII